MEAREAETLVTPVAEPGGAGTAFLDPLAARALLRELRDRQRPRGAASPQTCSCETDAGPSDGLVLS